jgi:hypothetical protein
MSDHLSRISAELGSDNHQNPRWPPIKNNYIAVRRGVTKTMIGVVRYVSPSWGECVIHLLSGFKNKTRAREVETLVRGGQDPENFALVVESDNWEYVETRKVREISKYVRQYGYPKLSDDLTGREMVFARATDRPVTLHDLAIEGAAKDPDTAMRLTELIDLRNITGFEFLRCHDELELMLDKTYGEEMGVDIRDYTAERADAFKMEMRMIQEEARAIRPASIEINAALLDNLIEDDEYLEENSARIANEILSNLRVGQRTPYDDSIRLIYNDNYLHALRNTLPLKEVITQELLEDDLMRDFKVVESEDSEEDEYLTRVPRTKEELAEVPSLYYYDWQYDQPIDHNQLKMALYTTQNASALFEEDRLRLKEAELILSQEYFIALNPEPRYQIWTFEKLIKLWYADSVLEAEIRMIKMLVNTFRANAGKRYNRENGVKPMIVIYPRYGKRSTTNIVQRLAYWFALHESAIAWKNNPPSYYKQMNDLIAYTNSNNTIKVYYRRLIDRNGEKKNKNSPYVDGFSRIRDTAQKSRDILHQYIALE